MMPRHDLANFSEASGKIREESHPLIVVSERNKYVREELAIQEYAAYNACLVDDCSLTQLIPQCPHVVVRPLLDGIAIDAGLEFN